MYCCSYIAQLQFQLVCMVAIDTPMVLILFMLLFFSLQCYCDAQEFVGSGMDYNETANCSCIENYRDLELYVKDKREIIEKLKSAFFVTGEAPSKFVKILYNFKICNDFNDSVESIMNCSNYTSKYIWSESALYLLGPNTLALFTFFAVDTPEITTTIDLPCLCHDAYDNLLSRLTYMV